MLSGGGHGSIHSRHQYTGTQVTKTDQLDFIKIKTACVSRDIIKKMKRLPTDWEKIFANHIYDKYLISRIYKELLQLKGK